MPCCRKLPLRALAKITYHFGIPSLRDFVARLRRRILNVGQDYTSGSTPESRVKSTQIRAPIPGTYFCATPKADALSNRKITRESSLLLILFCLLGLLSYSPPVNGQGLVEVAGTWESGTFHLGDPVTLHSEIPIPEGRYFLLGVPSKGQSWGSSVVTYSNSGEARNGTRVRLTVVVQVFGTGEILLPPAPITISTETGEQDYALVPEPLALAPLLGAAEQAPPPAAPMAYPKRFPWGWVFTGALAILGAIVLFVILWNRFRKRLEHRPAPPRPQELDPDRWILEEVERLFGAAMEPNKLYGLLSLRIREYLELKTKLPFPDWTTSEIRDQSLRVSLTEEEGLRQLWTSLDLCDRVKFARHKPTNDERDSTRDSIHAFIHELARPKTEGEAA